MIEGNIFWDLIRPDYLDNVTLFLVGLNIFFTALIFIYLHQKKKIRSIQKRIEKSLELWISRILLDENESEVDPAYLRIPTKFRNHFKNKTKREFTVNQLIDIKKNLTGKLVDNVINLYEHSGLKQDSVRKFKSNAWHNKVKGINELYMMDQKDMLLSIYKQTNSHNEFIRMEAQTAMIHFYGFEGLKFLDIITHSISEWEQLKLLEQLKTLDFMEMNNLSQWLKSANFTVVILALKLVDVYQQYQAHDEVVECLQHEHEKVRVQAVTTLGRIAREDTASVLAKHYLQEHFTNRQNILNCLLNVDVDITSHNVKGFLLQQLDDNNDFLKFAAARVIAKRYDNGLDNLKDKAEWQPNPYQEIYSHLKSELQ